MIAYDGMGRRTAIADTVGTTTTVTHYGWCGETLCQARTAADVPSKRYLAEGEEGTTGAPELIYGIDQLGSVRDAIGAQNGLRQRHYDYDPYGNLISTVGVPTVQTDMRYAGLFYHALSGLYLATYRAFDPVTGRWISRDPIEESGGMNLYGYVGGNPLTLIDPWGLCSCDSPSLGLGAIIGGGIGGALGSAGGAVGGVLLGGTGGTFVAPVVGTIAGAGVGADVGYVVGGVAGTAAGVYVGNQVGNALDNVLGALLPLDKGGRLFGQKAGCGADAGQRAAHAAKGKDNVQQAQDNYKIDPDTGLVYAPDDLDNPVGDANEHIGGKR